MPDFILKEVNFKHPNILIIQDFKKSKLKKNIVFQIIQVILILIKLHKKAFFSQNLDQLTV